MVDAETADEPPRVARRASLVVPIVASTQQDIRFSLQLDSLAARMAAAEALVAGLRAEYDALLAGQAAAVDDDGDPNDDGEWLGHKLVEQAIQLLQPPLGAPDV